MNIQQGEPLPLGVTVSKDGNYVQITVWAKDEKKCELRLYQQGKKARVFAMSSMEQQGAKDIFSLRFVGEHITEELADCEYMIKAGGVEFIDPYARRISGRDTFGQKGKARGAFSFDTFDWSDEKRPELDFSEMILYQCHVRGFTKHSSSGVSAPGTYQGVIDKIPYLKDLGVNTLLFLPLYDFNEVGERGDGKKIVNYWGYTKDAYYFAPKSSYGTGREKPGIEYKKMIKALHQQGMNILMDIHFQDKSQSFILDCLRYYVMEYHVDGFLVNQDVVSAQLVMNDPILRNVKLLGTGWPDLCEGNHKPRLATFNDGFMIDARRYLKSDEGMTGNFYQRFKNQGGNQAVINYLTQKNGFTLKDLVSYDVKHNEINGEKNQDGTEYNYSWNCGVEGVTRKKSVLLMRKQQMKNGLAFLLLSMGTPMLLAGDEFANTQKGNNNAYCQDNVTTWLDWDLLEKNQDVYNYVKKLIEFRVKCRVYDGRTFTGMDGKGAGAPDISCHGIEPWMNEFVNYSRELGIMFYKTYIDSTSSIYIAINMHWESHEFFLPVVDHGNSWKVLMDTSGKNKAFNSKYQKYVMDPRTVAVFEEVPGSKKPD